MDYINARKVVPILHSENATEIPESEMKEPHQTIHLKKIKRFGDIPVNLNRTTVHVPVNVYDQGMFLSLDHFDCLKFLNAMSFL